METVSSTAANYVAQMNMLPMLNGEDFKLWKENVEIVLGCMDLDNALRTEKPTSTRENPNTDKIEKWERSNRMCLMIMKRCVPEAFRGSIVETTDVKLFLKELEQYFARNEKAEIGQTLSKLINMRVKSNQDNIIIVQELIHSMHRMKGKKSSLSIKTDLEKAYDKLSWKFINSVLEDLKFPKAMVKAIMGYVTSPTLDILWNGARTEKFQSQRGIRQGDPLSPYLFVLCMEKLTHLILDEVTVGNWHPIRAGRSGPPISHLMFADDIILFAEASLSQLNCIVNCLEKFSLMSGQNVSIEKSCIYFSRNAPQEAVNSISEISGFKNVDSLGCYLGTRMRHERMNKNHYAVVIARVQDRLHGWKSKCLSLAGNREASKNFIWGDLESKRKAHYVAWEVMCQPKDRGGLGIINLRVQNEAFMHKLTWQITRDKDSLWARVLISKYGRNQDINRSWIAKEQGSSLWRNICLARHKMNNQLEWVLGNGRTVYFWTDLWGGWQGPLLELALTKPPMADLSLKLRVKSPPVPDSSEDWLNWKVGKPGSIPRNFLSAEGTEWSRLNLVKPFKSNLWHSWLEIFFVTCWFLWFWRNSTVHDITFSRPHEPVHTILRYLADIKNSNNADPFPPLSDSSNHIGLSDFTAQSSAQGNIRIFVDEAVYQASHIGACGGVACTTKAEWIRGFAYNIGVCSPLEAELWGILHGSIQETTQYFECVQLEYIPRDFNICADGLAKEGLILQGGEMKIFEFPTDSYESFWFSFCTKLMVEQ
ncbi:uncharacterized protein LOC133307489, partial [Gastrolobium bilobum]|uniref:uncharacterized protein LOC133307489 n=1 Tax=Gastrolobium bilobum TaxID=150636 RepID=UPI002AB27B23